MESSRFLGDSSSALLYVAALATAFCCLFALRVVRSLPLASIFRKARSKKKLCGCSCSCGRRSANSNYVSLVTSYANGGSAGEIQKSMPVVAERQTGASMMEQLVPEITTHVLSYLDCMSLCRLSMTNSLMRRAANDDSAWKALYHKDFTVEQESVRPVNGWKAYYAATRAVMKVNTEFYNIIREKSLPAMSRLWLHADYAKCFHGCGELFIGYEAVMQSWNIAFNLGPDIAFQIRDVRARVLTDMAWITMKAYVDVMETGSFHVTNVYEFHKGQWYMVHHHSSVMLPNVEVDHQNWEIFFP